VLGVVTTLRICKTADSREKKDECQDQIKSRSGSRPGCYCKSWPRNDNLERYLEQACNMVWNVLCQFIYSSRSMDRLRDGSSSEGVSATVSSSGCTAAQVPLCNRPLASCLHKCLCKPSQKMAEACTKPCASAMQAADCAKAAAQLCSYPCCRCARRLVANHIDCVLMDMYEITEHKRSVTALPPKWRSGGEPPLGGCRHWALTCRQLDRHSAILSFLTFC
jgi:hypothetical protein